MVTPGANVGNDIESNIGIDEKQEGRGGKL
jgi:hypothetical protein